MCLAVGTEGKGKPLTYKAAISPIISNLQAPDQGPARVLGFRKFCVGFWCFSLFCYRTGGLL